VVGWICDILDDLGNEATIDRVREEVKELCARLPVYGEAEAQARAADRSADEQVLPVQPGAQCAELP
jgi:hypothetical protein